MKITTLIEDTTCDDKLFCEMGFSLLIETEQDRILLDTGRTGKFADNSATLGVDLDNLDACVLSHGHFDHGGGLERFFKENRQTAVFMHNKAIGHFRASNCTKMSPAVGALLHPFIKNSLKFSRFIGLDAPVLEKNANRIQMVKKPREIKDNIYLITDIPRNHPAPHGNKFLMTSEGGQLSPDPFRHEMILAIKEPDGIVLFSGCCHNGILNMIDAMEDFFKGAPVKAVVGGFHLVLQPGKDRMACTPQQVADLCQILIKKGIEKIYTGHCTGQQAFEELASHLGNRVKRLSTGAVFNI